MARRATYVNTLTSVDSASVLHVDCGDLIGSKGAFEELKARYLFEAYDAMNIDCMNFGTSDALLGQGFLLEHARESGVPLISANVYFFDTAERFLRPYIIKRVSGKRFLGLEWGGIRVAVFGVLQPLDETASIPWDKEKGEHRLIFKDPAVVAREMVEELRPKADIIICLAHTGWLQARALARSVTGIDLMIVGNGSNVKGNPNDVNGTPLVMPGDEGKYLGIFEFYLDEHGKIEKTDGRSQELDETIEDDPAMAELVKRYNEELKTLGKEIVPASSQLDVVKFLGAEACSECHMDAYGQWRGTGHARSIESLVKEGQDYNPSCLKCHVTGYGFFNGFHSYEKTPGMVNVQCEACHGSGSDHVRWARGETPVDSDRDPARKYLFAADEDRCTACHDAENDADFSFAADLQKVLHRQDQNRGAAGR